MNYTGTELRGEPCVRDDRGTIVSMLNNLATKIKDSLERTYRLLGAITGDAPEFPKLEEPKCIEQQLIMMYEYAARLEDALDVLQGKMGF